MSRFTSVLDGAEVTDQSLAEGGFDYILFTRKDGSGIIMRLNSTQTEIRFHFFGGQFDVQNQWDNRTDHTYIRPSDLKKP